MEKKWNELGYRDRLSFVLCISAFVLSAVLLVAGLVIPPQGEIHASVLTALGMLLTFVGSVLGISQHYNTQLNKIKSELHLQ